MSTGFNLKLREKKAVQEAVDEAICLCQSLQEELVDKMPCYKPKSQMARVVNIIVKFAKRNIDDLRQQTKRVNDDLIQVLGSMQESLKKTEPNDCTPELSAKYAKLNEVKLRFVSVRKSWRYRVQFTTIVLRLLRPFAKNEKSRTNLVEGGAIDKTYEFLLDLFLPPDRAEETSTALQDVCQSKWQKRYGPRRVAFLCFVHTISTIYAHHTVRLCKLGGSVLGITELKKAFSKLWGA